jgi:hypothetical protein
LQIDEIEKVQRCYKQAIDESDFPLGSALLEALLLMLNEATNMKLAQICDGSLCQGPKRIG